MATQQLDPMTERALDGWKSFSRLIGFSSLGLIILVSLLAIFLL